MKSFLRTAYQIGQLVEEKNAAYGSSFAKAGQFLELLYPNGIQPEQFDDALLLVRIFDKQMRIATDRDALGESPYRDIAGYGILGATHVEERRIEACGNASAGDVANPLKDATASAAKSAGNTSRRKSSGKTARKSSAVAKPAATAGSNSRNRR